MRIVVLLVFVLLVFVSLVDAQENNASFEDDAKQCLREGEKNMLLLESVGFSVQRVNDSLRIARSIFDGQVILQQQESQFDYSPVLIHCDNIDEVTGNALKAKDDLFALSEFFRDALGDEEIDFASVNSIIDEIHSEIASERYEKIPPLIDEGYETISELKAQNTKVRAFYSATSSGVQDFFGRYWQFIVVCVFGIIIFYFLVRKSIAKFNLRRRMKNLDFRKKTIKELIKKTQKDYFEKGNISESSFSIKTKKFTELILEIDRKLSVSLQELTSIEGVKKSLVSQKKRRNP